MNLNHHLSGLLNSDYRINVCDSFSTNPAVPIRLSNNNLIIAVPYEELC
jgi:hypothetical protein